MNWKFILPLYAGNYFARKHKSTTKNGMNKYKLIEEVPCDPHEYKTRTHIGHSNVLKASEQRVCAHLWRKYESLF